MSITDAKKLITEKLGWKIQDVFFLCKDMNMFAYYIVYKNHRIKCICAVDELNGCASGVWE